jgi:aryl-alcohol dehydrogenase-like predicted oxidoreductase
MKEKPMKTRRLGQTDLELTVIGLGTWAIGGPWQYGWGPQEDRDSLEAIGEALECGINWIDTAPIYGCGHSEEVVGRALRQFRPRPLVATKCGLLWNSQREKISCLDARSITAECEASLKRLGVEVIDLYQMHWPQPEEQIEEGWEAMVRLVEQGKVRYAGVCNFTVPQLERIERMAPPASLQPPYSMLQRDIEAELLPYCSRKKIGVVVYSPLQKGLLTGKFTEEYLKTLPPDDHRVQTDPNFRQPLFGRNLRIIERLKDVAAQAGMTVGQLAVAWVLRKLEVTSAIVGARRKGQIREIAPAAEAELPESLWEEVENILNP